MRDRCGWTLSDIFLFEVTSSEQVDACKLLAWAFRGRRDILFSYDQPNNATLVANANMRLYSMKLYQKCRTAYYCAGIAIGVMPLGSSLLQTVGSGYEQLETGGVQEVDATLSTREARRNAVWHYKWCSRCSACHGGVLPLRPPRASERTSAVDLFGRRGAAHADVSN